MRTFRSAATGEPKGSHYIPEGGPAAKATGPFLFPSGIKLQRVDLSRLDLSGPGAFTRTSSSNYWRMPWLASFIGAADACAAITFQQSRDGHLPRLRVVGAVIGSRMLFWFEDPQRTLTQAGELPISGRWTNDRWRLDWRLDWRRVAKATHRHS